MAVKEKTMNTKLYAVIVFFAIAAALAIITVATFTSKYTAFHAEDVAQAYVDSIVQSGDGYNAYKYSLVSKSEKYGDYIRIYYMYPLIYGDAGYQPGDDTGDLTGLDDEANMSDASKNDDGTLAGQVIDEMYPYYTELITEYGWDNYDLIFTSYFAKFQEVRAQVFGDSYLSDEVMFTALEANVATYGEALTGTEEEVDSDSGVTLGEKSTGIYQVAYGDDYALTVTVKEIEAIQDVAAYTASMDAEMLNTYGVGAEDIDAASNCTVEVALQDGTVVATQDVTVVQIGNSWYVDNTTVNTLNLYNFYA